jgi:hypothetical protein
MNYFLFAVFALAATAAYAEIYTPDRIAREEKEAVLFYSYLPVEEVRKFLDEKKGCKVAIGFSPHNRDSKIVAHKVWCITERVYYQGTIDEISGCAFTVFNITTGEYQIPGTNSGPHDKPIIVKKASCDFFGINQLLEAEMKDASQPKKVKDYIGGGSSTRSYFYPTLIVNDHQRIADAVGKARDQLDALYVEHKLLEGLKKFRKK